jgi:hypothetical protein
MITAFRQQIDWSNSLGSPFTAQLLALLAEDLMNGGRTAELVGTWSGDAIADAVPLRLTGALHALVLKGAAPDLASCYPPHHHAFDRNSLRSAVRSTLTKEESFIRQFFRSPPQTNEVGRSSVLLGGFLLIAQITRLPLRLLEIGASAGLNLIWDSYRYQIREVFWGNPTSPVMLKPEWQGGLPPLAARVQIDQRSACDMAPVDLDDEEQRLRLRAYVWPDQTERLERLDAAIAVARREGHKVERADASNWVAAKLATMPEGLATVLFHSIMWQYVPAREQARITRDIHAAGERATKSAPLAWLRFETTAVDRKSELHLTIWPGEHQHRLAAARAHGNAVTWLPDSAYNS